MERIQDYTIIKKIDETRGSVVYSARCENTNEAVIIKVLKASYASSSEIARFKQEYELIKQIDFNGVVKIYDLIEFKGEFALILEDFNGIPLNNAFSKRPITITAFLEIAISLSETLGNLHKSNIVHMDIKPRNILINPNSNQVKITDFGISTQMTRENEEIYHPDIIKGTLAYLSPEQTGRLNRQLDYRTDLYSLGVTFYEILTGNLPFIFDDPMEMIHAHIAKKPIPPIFSNPEIPEVVSDIIMKLMSKTAENRYQNSFGLMADLQKCLNLVKTGDIPPFQLGSKDISLKFTIPQKLYGRDEEFKHLVDGFYQARQGTPNIMLVSGAPGIGKTALINELQKNIIEKKGFFISGKYEQMRQDVPYSAIIHAFQGLIRQILCENREMVEKWKQQLLNALFPNEAIITQMIPEVAHLIGPQPNIMDSGSEEFKNRFILAFKKFINVFSQIDHPLVMFLDDVQWADLSSLQVFKSLVTDPDMTYLFVIASFRNNEVTDSHPFTLCMNEVKKHHVPVGEIVLGSLEPEHVNRFILDFLRCSDDRSRPLAELIHKKTGGNPFFINQFMKTLHDLKLLQVMQGVGWQWDLDHIRQMQLTDNVVDLLSDKIVQLPESTCEMLKIGSCIGNIFDLERLSSIVGKPMETLWGDVKNAVNEGYIDIFKDFLKFQHDRIREAAYQLLPEKKRQEIHYQIGWHTFNKTDPENLSSEVFYIADHLNHAKTLLKNKKEQDDLAYLNLMAGEKAIYSAAYASALTYLEQGIFLLREDAWSLQYDLSLKLYKGAVAAAALEGRFDLMQTYCASALEKCMTALDQITFYEFLIMSHVAKNNLPEAVNTGLTILKLLDITFPEKPNKLNVLNELIRVKLALRGKEPEDLLNLPELTDLRILAAGRIFAKISTPAFQTNPDLYVLIGFKRILLSIKYGNSPGSSLAYAVYGVLQCAILEDFDIGYRFGVLALNLLDKLNDTEFKAQIIMTFYGFIKHWKDPLKASLLPLLEGFQIGKETGKLEHGAYCLFLYGGYSLLTGTPLPLFDEEITKHIRIVSQMNQETALHYMTIDKQVVLNLRGDVENPTHLTGSAYDETKMLPCLQKSKDQAGLAYFYSHKMFLNYLFGNMADARANAELVKENFAGTRSNVNAQRYYLFSALIDLAQYRDAGKSVQKRILKNVSKSLKKLKKYADHSPGTSRFAYYFLTAELAGVMGDYKKAISFYDKTIESTQEFGLLNYEAVANEQVAKFYLSNSHFRMAATYMQEARIKYDQWGASAKIKHIDGHYPELVSITTRKAYARENEKNTSLSTLPTMDATRNFDFSSLIKASEAIFGEIVLGKLLKRLMKILLENAGAEKGLIILKENDTLLIEAEGRIGSEEINVLKSIPIDSHQGLSAAMVTYAARTKETILLNDAVSEGTYIRDPYVIKNKPKSVLCMPVLNQGRLSAILYLENNLTTNVFTPERLRILNMVSSQLAVSINNARLYETLEQKVEARTAQLKLAQMENLKKAHRAGMADIAKETLHNVGNILTSVKTTADTLKIKSGDSALSGLTSANRLLRNHMHDLNNFIQSDPKGKKLMDYYLVLEELFEDERKKTNQKINRLQQKVDEIVKVIQALQSYIGSDDTYLEHVRLKEEVQFVLETKQDILMKSNITVQEKYDDAPMIRVQKSKLAHILDNLILNAKEAMEDIPTQEKTIKIEVGHKNNCVLLHICDNGQGISKENIRKIFFHGFTTKAGRSGHSLHNCANNMTEMGGRIRVESKGEGKGATFTLEFPVQGK